MGQYYFVAAALPPISLAAKPEISFHELKDLFALNLSDKDQQKFHRLLRLTDLHNIRALWMGLPFDPRGNFSPKELEEALLIPEMIPTYLQDYLSRYENQRDRLHYFSSLFASLFQDMKERSKGFLRAYYALERELSLVLTALRAKRFGRDVVKELQFEDFDDPLVAGILAQKDAPEYTPPAEYEEVKQLFQTADDPRALYRRLLEYKLTRIEELERGEPFSIDHLLGVAARLLIVESWWGLDEEQGRALIEDLSQYG